MAELFSNMVSVEDEIQRCLHREAEEREAAARAADACARDAHVALARRYADRANMLAGRSDRAAAPDGRKFAAALPRYGGAVADAPS